MTTIKEKIAQVKYGTDNRCEKVTQIWVLEDYIKDFKLSMVDFFPAVPVLPIKEFSDSSALAVFSTKDGKPSAVIYKEKEVKKVAQKSK